MNEEFEKWFADRFKGALDFDDEASDGNAAAAIARIVGIEAWQASRKQALQESIKAAEHVQQQLAENSKIGGFFHSGSIGVSVCVDAIRALQKE